ncbi:DeoR/GlpR family DNA-binding transcription regulator [Anaerolentibacter hominis]|uniref:DeoR/GlpR family DNA-binding transcription regulator n=1 Tax=Anaerolentibacter hominis TaxID=3079009 RepID=UPI0031B7F19D
MYQEERLYHIMGLLKERKVLSRTEIMEQLNISRDTARRDILKLVDQGLVYRTHGGITLPAIRTRIGTYKERLSINSELKMKLGKAAAKYIHEGDLCFLDVATTIQSMCPFINMKSDIYTHSIDNVELLADNPLPSVHILPGELNRINRYFFGSETITHLHDLNFDVAFLGAGALTEEGIFVRDSEDAYIKRAAVEKAAFTCLVSDAEKLLVRSTHRAVPLTKIDLLITTRPISAEFEKALKKAGTDLEIVESDN